MKHDSSRRRYLTDFLFFTVLFASVSVLLFGAVSEITNSAAARTGTDTDVLTRPVIVLDPGHGGEDGGASGADGTAEKDLNLTVASAVAEILSAAGYDVRLTRTEDRLLYDLYGDLTDYTGHKKTYDLRNRLRFTKDAGASLFVSIHMNKFSDPQYSGLQVYYSPARPESQTVASLVQNYAKLYLQPDNDRAIKKATSSIYLLARSEIPAILVECGFLSNEEELSRLTDPLYQKQLALTIACAIAESMTGIAA